MSSKVYLRMAAVLQLLLTVFVFLWWGVQVGTLLLTGSTWLLLSVRAYGSGRVTRWQAAHGVFLQLLGTYLAFYWWSWQLSVVWFVGISWTSMLVIACVVVEGSK